MVKAVIFDLFDTLVSAGDLEEDVCREFGLDPEEKHKDIYDRLGVIVAETNEPDARKLAAPCLRAMCLPASKENVRKINGVFNNVKNRMALYSDSVPVLKKLKSRGLKLGLIS
ncbi:MAG: hypothetical protein Q7K42_02755, partial [Candidatus Diapherotrites archaeon]|nr:hypothetical protein [Candidatus Diapherotrites archaeon]